MHNQKSTTSRALAFWFGLTLHLALGTALYFQTIGQPAARVRIESRPVPVAVMPARP